MTVGSTGPQPAGTSSEMPSVADMLAMLLRHRRTVLLFPVLVALLATGATPLKPRTYTASTSFTPQQTEAVPLIPLAHQLRTTEYRVLYSVAHRTKRVNP